MSLKTILEQKNAHIDKLVAQFEKDIGKFTKGLSGDLMDLFNAGRFDKQYITALFTEHGFDKLAVDFIDRNNELFKYARDISGELGIGFKLGEKSLNLLSRVADANLGKILGSRDAIVNSIIDAGLQSEIQKLPFKQVVARLNESVTELGRRINTEAFTGISIFDRTVRAEQLDNAGITKYVYLGPFDNKTRDACRQVLESPYQETGWTLDQIRQSSVDFIGGGGYNCRHEWMAFVEGVAPKEFKDNE